MATGNVTVTTAANHIPELWAAPILDYAARIFSLRNKVRDVSELLGMSPTKGDTIHVPRVSEETAGTKAANTAVTYTTFTDPVTDISIDQHPYVAKRIENIAKVQANYDLLDPYAKAMGYGLAKQVENYLAVTILQAATAHDITLTTDNQVTAAEFRTAEQNLMDEGYDVDIWKRTGELFFYSNPAVHQYLKGLGTFTDYNLTGIAPGANWTGFMPSIYGNPAFVSTDWGSVGTAGEEAATLFAKEGVLLAMQQDIQMSFRSKEDDPDYLADSLTVYMLYGAALAYAAADTTGPIVNMNQP